MGSGSKTVSPALMVIYGLLGRIRASKNCIQNNDFRTRVWKINGKGSPKKYIPPSFQVFPRANLSLRLILEDTYTHGNLDSWTTGHKYDMRPRNSIVITEEPETLRG